MTHSYPQDQVIFSPSILAANFGEFANAAKELDQAGAKSLHIDIMDGHFVPNLTFGPQLVKDLRPVSNAFFDVHLMVENPEKYFHELAEAGAQRLIIHPESTYHLDRALHEIKGLGMQCGVALNPATPIEHCEWVLDIIDSVLIMTVNPGFGGQSYIVSMNSKIASLADLRSKKNANFEIGVDGGITSDTAPYAIEAGATYLVAGSSIFKEKNGPGEGYTKLSSQIK